MEKRADFPVSGPCSSSFFTNPVLTALPMFCCVLLLLINSPVDAANYAYYYPATYGSYWTYQNEDNSSDTYTISVFATYTFGGHPAVKIGTDSDNYQILYNDGNSVTYYGYVEEGVLHDITDVSFGSFDDGEFFQIGSPSNYKLWRLWDNIDPSLKAAYGIDPTLENLLLEVTLDSDYPSNSHNSMAYSNLGGTHYDYAVTHLQWYQLGVGMLADVDIQATTGEIESRYNLTDYYIAPIGLYRLALTVVSDTALKGGGSVHGDGGIACSNTGSDPTEQSGKCYADFLPGSTVTIYQTPDANSTWATWSVPSCGTSDQCQMVMSSPINVTATFPYAYMAKINSTGEGYDSLVQAAANSGETDTILARAVTFAEDLNIADKYITLSGGLTLLYETQDAWTILEGELTIQSGSLAVDRLEIK